MMSTWLLLQFVVTPNLDRHIVAAAIEPSIRHSQCPDVVRVSHQAFFMGERGNIPHLPYHNKTPSAAVNHGGEGRAAVCPNVVIPRATEESSATVRVLP